MFGFLKKLFDGADDEGPVELEATDYNGYSIIPTPRKEAQGFRVQGRIEKTIDGQLKSYPFVRADVYSGQDDTVAVIIQKGQRLVDEQGEKLFTGQPADRDGLSDSD